MPLTKYKYWPALSWFLICTFLFCLPGSVIPNTGLLGVRHLDKLVHFVLFFILIYLLFIPRIEHARHSFFWIITILAISYGIAIEYIQQNWVANRSFDTGDIIADAAGALAAHFYCWNKRLSYQKK